MAGLTATAPAVDLERRTICRACRGSFHELIDFGSPCVSEFVERPEEPGDRAPLRLVVCSDCNLAQLDYTYDRERLYRHYWYRSGVNESMRAALGSLAKAAVMRAGLRDGGWVLDIGANDGTLLESIPDKYRRVGFEPARNLSRFHAAHYDIIPEFFSAQAWKDHYGKQKVDLVTAVAMFYDLEDPRRFLLEVGSILAPDGILVVQQNYLPRMLDTCGYDSVCHEHVTYWALGPLCRLVNQCGLEVLHVEFNGVNGGSFRTYIGIGERGPAVKEALKAERLEFAPFARRVPICIEELYNLVVHKVGRGSRVAVYGASTKGNTILQAAQIDSSLCLLAADRNPEKWGLYTVGTGIAIQSEATVREQAPDYFLALPWHFERAFLAREVGYLNDGGRFIFPLPQVRVTG